MPINDIIDGLFNNIELNGQIRSRYLRVRFFYIGYIFIFNGCLRVLLSMCHSFFRGCILRIFFMCAQKQVFWVYARRIIALVAKNLLKKFGSVKEIFNADEKKLMKTDKIGEKKAREIRKLIDAEYKEE